MAGQPKPREERSEATSARSIAQEEEARLGRQLGQQFGAVVEQRRLVVLVTLGVWPAEEKRRVWGSHVRMSAKPHLRDPSDREWILRKITQALPPRSEWTLDRQEGLMRRCPIGLEKLDVAMGGDT